MDYLGEDFLLQSPTARRLYHECAALQPIVDIHTNLSAAEIADRRHWSSLTEAWLAGDPEKGRLMRALGIDESFIAGDAPDLEKFRAWAETIDAALRNPVYDDSHLELRRGFGIDALLSAETADRIWDQADAQLGDLDCWSLLDKFKVAVLATCDDPAEPLDAHRRLAEAGPSTRILPSFSTARIFEVDRPERLNPWIERLEAVGDTPIHQLGDFLTAITKRHESFHEIGCRLSDHRFERLPASGCDDADAAIIFEKARSGSPATREELERFSFYMLGFLAQLDTSRGWTMKLHLGGNRGISPDAPGMEEAGCGLDAVSDLPQAPGLIAVLGHLASEDSLPQVIIDSLAPGASRLVASLAGSFEDAGIPGKVRFGACNRQTRGRRETEALIDHLSASGLLRQSVGFLSGSSSFLSLARHERFRRILCNLLGSEADRGEIPADFDLLASYVTELCGAGVRRFLGIPQGATGEAAKSADRGDF